MDPVAVYIPRCGQNGSESLGLKTLEDFGVGIRGSPILIAVFNRSIWV
jgi:hypothetical protein